MTLAGLIGISLVAAFVVGTLLLALLRFLLVNWCPACSGRGYETDSGWARRCTACGGSGVLRVPDHLPADWPAEDEQRPHRAPRR
jgi:DnaJ-class molecular chaperone